MLYDKDFLLKLDKSKNKTIYARITALKFNETPVETIEGRVTGGSINIDGASAIRRSCSLTMVAQEFDYNDYYWGLNSKFKLEIGVQNKVDSSMPDIIWFNQGIYLINSFNTSRSTTNFTISISGKDKMCLLNGEAGGALEAPVDFGQIEEEDSNGVWTIRKIPIQEIIRNAVHTYAGEPYWNIIINDLDAYGLELLEYRYDTPMYLYRDADPDTGMFHNAIMENDTTKVKLSRNATETVTLAELKSSHLDTMVESLKEGHKPEPVWFNDKPYYFAKVEYGQNVGYRITDLVYPGDLMANIGEPITSVLDKIKNMLTEFEYFYDLDGRFVFQKKKSFISTIWGADPENESENPYIKESLALSSSTAYTFSGSELITAFNNNPNLMNMRNDYSIWGQRTGSSGAAIPVHMRYAIDNKPVSYTQISFDPVIDQESIYAIEEYNARYNTTLEARQVAETFNAEDSDWREVIYQMALDYYKYNMLENFELLLARANPDLYPTGQTGYERYYIDLQGFWRELYNPELQIKINVTRGELETAKQQVENIKTRIANGITDPLELDHAKKNLRSWEIEVDNLTIALEHFEEDIEEYYYNDDAKDRKYWHKNVFEHPEMLNFWFDFLDTEGELQQFSVKNVGSRSKPINDTNVKSIYFRETPPVVFTDSIAKESSHGDYRYIQIPKDQMETMFTISAQGKSAKDRLDELIYQHGYCIESATINAIPIYYLEPNVRIYIHDEDTGIDGEYVVSKITLPLAYNGTMSLTATKAAENVL